MSGWDTPLARLGKRTWFYSRLFVHGLCLEGGDLHTRLALYHLTFSWLEYLELNTVYWIWKTYTSLGLAAFCSLTLVLETSMIGEYTEISGLVKGCSRYVNSRDIAT